MSRNSFDVAIIGGGLIGCFSAYFLPRRGRSVAVIENSRACRVERPQRWQSAIAGPRWQGIPALAPRTVDLGGPRPPHRGDCGVVPSGHLGFAPSDAQRCEAIAPSARAAGLATEIVDGSAARRCCRPFSRTPRGQNGMRSLRPRSCAWRCARAQCCLRIAKLSPWNGRARGCPCKPLRVAGWPAGMWSTPPAPGPGKSPLRLSRWRCSRRSSLIAPQCA